MALWELPWKYPNLEIIPANPNDPSRFNVTFVCNGLIPVVTGMWQTPQGTNVLQIGDDLLQAAICTESPLLFINRLARCLESTTLPDPINDLLRRLGV